tara:strand:+ start:771 stop:1901 length:1131 start_codon:yes stop_codon:yes gene_type:complete
MKSQIKKIKNKFKTKFINFQSIKYAKSEKEFELPDIASYDAISNEWRLEDDCEEEVKALYKSLRYGKKDKFFNELKKIELKSQHIIKTNDELKLEKNWKKNLDIYFHKSRENDYLKFAKFSTNNAKANQLKQEGYTTFKLNNLKNILEILKPEIKEIKELPQNNDTTQITWDRIINVTSKLKKELEKQIFLDAKMFKSIKSFLGGNSFEINYAGLIFSTDRDLQYRLFLGDIKTKDNELINFHIDPKQDLLKSIIYLSDVNENDGPFTIVPKSHLFSIDLLTDLFGRSIATGNYCNSEYARKSIFRLPSRLRKSFNFGRLIKKNSKEEKIINKNKHCITGEAGTSILFLPGNTMHRGAVCGKNGSRLALQIQIKRK